MSNTPRADAAMVRMERLDGDIDEVVSADFAKRLEGYLAAAEAQLQEAWRQVADARHDIERLTESLTAEVNKAPLSATAAMEPVAEVEEWPASIYGLRIHPLTAWVNIPVGTKLYAAPQAARVEETAKSCIRVVPI